MNCEQVRVGCRVPRGTRSPEARRVRFTFILILHVRRMQYGNRCKITLRFTLHLYAHTEGAGSLTEAVLRGSDLRQRKWSVLGSNMSPALDYDPNRAINTHPNLTLNSNYLMHPYTLKTYY
ncbi:hypothetical protein EVAR_786_1 [Eumeta japonica]|uniref:Uncharacterized protein n=1 Tax=Eumeta variegata TaxID=151549 RepID=A0A4C1SC54_EUMVA|nr:hypothetical protein EVAR_786_1 [Eumeta japonica]